MIGLVHGSNLWQTTYSFSPSSASIMPTEVCEALDKYQPEYVVVWGKRLWIRCRASDGRTASR